MKSGLHGPNRAVSDIDLKVMRAGQFRAVKLLLLDSCRHSLEDVARVRSALPNAEIYLRLPDSRTPDGRYLGAYEWAAKAASLVRPFIAVGVNRLQVCNELQYEWASVGYGPFECAFWLRLAVEKLRALLPTVHLISPPLSWSPALWRHNAANPTPYTLDEWLAAYDWNAGGTEPTLWRLFDSVGANVYFQSARQMNDPSYGASFGRVYTESGGMPVTICEYGCSARDLVPRPQAAEIGALMCQLYPQFLAWLRSFGGEVEAAFAFISEGATPDWNGFLVTERIASAMCERVAVHSGGGSGARPVR